MTAALTPELAIAYVRELSADVRAVVVLAADGSCLAGPEPVARAARAYLDAAGSRPDVATRTPAGLVLAARTAVHAVVVAAGPLSLTGPTALDARAAAQALAGPVPEGAAKPPAEQAGPAPTGPAGAARGEADALRRGAEAVLSAAQSAI